LPPTAGVYAVLAGGDVVLYVGSSTDLRRRRRRHNMLQHLTEWPDVRIAWPATDDLDAVEQGWIAALKPLLNSPRATRRRQPRETVLPKRDFPARMPTEPPARLTEMAEREHRSVNTLIVHVLRRKLKEHRLG
jgi:hypothetical protein